MAKFSPLFVALIENVFGLSVKAFLGAPIPVYLTQKFPTSVGTAGIGSHGFPKGGHIPILNLAFKKPISGQVNKKDFARIGFYGNPKGARVAFCRYKAGYAVVFVSPSRGVRALINGEFYSVVTSPEGDEATK